MKTILWIVGIIAVIGLGWWAVSRSNGTQVANESSTSPTPSDVASVSDTTVAGYTAGSAAYVAYDQLVKQYGLNRIQFDESCQAIPKTIVVPNGTSVMFDNRSGDARTIEINDVSYSFPGYGYKIIDLSGTALPRTTYINCGSAIHTGTITIEK